MRARRSLLTHALPALFPPVQVVDDSSINRKMLVKVRAFFADVLCCPTVHLHRSSSPRFLPSRRPPQVLNGLKYTSEEAEDGLEALFLMHRAMSGPDAMSKRNSVVNALGGAEDALDRRPSSMEMSPGQVSTDTRSCPCFVLL